MIDLSIKRMQAIVESVIYDEAKQENLEVSTNAMTLVEYYKSDFFKNSIKLYKGINKFEAIETPFKSKGINSYDEIFVFLNHFNEIIKIGNNFYVLIELLKTSFHELAHSRQRKNRYVKKSSNEGVPFETTVMIIFENEILNYNYNFYKTHHDRFLMEIDANLYGYIKTKEFIIDISGEYNRQNKLINGKETFDEYLEYIDDKIEFWSDRYDDYNFDLIFKKYHQIHKKNSNCKWAIDRLIYEENSSNFKRISDIVDSKDNVFDKKTIYSIITSNTYLEQLDFNKLTERDAIILVEALKYFKNDSVEEDDDEKEDNYLLNIYDSLKNELNSLLEPKSFKSKINKDNLLTNLEECLEQGLFSKESNKFK
jgi:hypothetical protein